MKIAIIDPASWSLPYDIYYINEISKYYNVDFYYSATKFNYEYIKKIRKNKNINLIEYNISNINKLKGIINYKKMLDEILKREKEYFKIHFLWSIFFPLELFYFYKIRKKFIFTFHNDKPHNYKRNRYFPYQIIFNLTNKNIFVSWYTKERFFKNYKVKDNKSLIVNHGLLPINIDFNYIRNDNFEKSIIFWGLVKDYKGIDIFLKLVNREELQDYKFEIYGKWDKSTLNIKNQLIKYKRVKIEDKFLSPFELVKKVLSRKAIFILPYKDATQSGVLFTYLNYGLVFISSNVGENSRFLKEKGLNELVFDRENVDSIINCIKKVEDDYDFYQNKICQLKENLYWDKILTKETVRKIYE